MNISKKIEIGYCAATRGPNESNLKCLMRTRNGNKYCPMHLLQKNVKDFILTDADMYALERDNEIDEMVDESYNPIIKKISLLPPINVRNMSNTVKNTDNSTMRENKISTVTTSYEEEIDELEVKLLILANDDEYKELIPKLVGPVFDDVTISEDQVDPFTFDEFWRMENDSRISASMNKYYLFSYLDSDDKVRCFTIFSINNMIDNEENKDIIHPVTGEKIPDEDINRAKELITLYQTKIGLFSDGVNESSPEYELKNRIIKLFKKFHTFSIYFNEEWLLSIEERGKLLVIIRETRRLIINNRQLVNPRFTNPGLFSKKINNNDTSFFLKEYIVYQWEELIKETDSPQNQIPIWIIALGLSKVVPEVGSKFPNLDMILS